MMYSQTPQFILMCLWLFIGLLFINTQDGALSSLSINEVGLFLSNQNLKMSFDQENYLTWNIEPRLAIFLLLIIFQHIFCTEKLKKPIISNYCNFLGVTIQVKYSKLDILQYVILLLKRVRISICYAFVITASRFLLVN